MLTISIVALMSATPTTGTVSGMSMQVRACTHMVLKENGMTEEDARRITAGTKVRVGTKVTTFKSGDSVWRLCEKHMVLAQQRHENRVLGAFRLHPFRGGRVLKYNSTRAYHHMA